MRNDHKRNNNIHKKGSYIPVSTEDFDPAVFGYFEEPLTREQFFSITDNWFQTGNAALFLGYSGLYGARFLNDASVSLHFVRLYFFSWNYFDFIARTFMHAYNITEIIKSRRDVGRQLLLESLDMSATLAMGAGTTLSLLAQQQIITGTLAVFCAPLASLTTSFCALVMGFIELSKCYKAYRKTQLPVLLRDRLKRYTRLKKVLEEKGLKPYEQKALQEECDALLAQSLAIARVYCNEDAEKQVGRKGELTALLERLKINGPELNITNLTQRPNAIDKALVNYEVNKQYAIGRNHAFNAGFWLLVGTGLALSSLATFLFPPLLIPAVVVIGVAVAVKAAQTLELDKRLYNGFVGTEKKKAIGNDNPIMNYLARRKKEKEIEKEYIENRINNGMQHVPRYFDNKKRKKIPDAIRVRMCIAFELSIHNHMGSANGKQFYEQFLQLSWWKRRQYLHRAMEKKLESEALSDPTFYASTIAKGLLQEDKDVCIAQWCRKNYRLFGKPPPKTSHVNPVAAAAAKAGGVGGP